jgi:hypothetical protein
MEAPNRITFQSHSQSYGGKGPHRDTSFYDCMVAAKGVWMDDRTDPPESPRQHVVWIDVMPQTGTAATAAHIANAGPSVVKCQFITQPTPEIDAIMTSVRDNPKVKHMIIRYSTIQDHYAQVVNTVLKNNDGIAWLVLDHNRIDDTTVRRIFKDLPPNRGIEHVVLSHNRITDKGIPALTQAFGQMPRIKTVWLDHNDVSDGGAGKLVAAFNETSPLQTLDLRRNRLTKAVSGSFIRRCYC